MGHVGMWGIMLYGVVDGFLGSGNSILTQPVGRPEWGEGMKAVSSSVMVVVQWGSCSHSSPAHTLLKAASQQAGSTVHHASQAKRRGRRKISNQSSTHRNLPITYFVTC